MLVLFGVAFCLIVYRLVAIQGSHGYAQVSSATQQSLTLYGLRGSILAANGNELAFSEERPTIFADPGEIADPAGEAVKLAGVLHRSAFTLQSQLSAKTTYVPLVTGASNATAKAVSKLGLPGIGTVDEPIRYYADGTLGLPLIGRVNAAGGGVGGLEQTYNGVLQGKNGKIVRQVDPQGLPVAGDVTTDRPATDGDDILTTINPALQYQVDQILAADLVHSKGTEGVIMVEDTRTGKILADSNMQMDGNKAVEATSNFSFMHTFDPGSVGKIVTVSAGLAQHKITPTSKIADPYSLNVADSSFHDDWSHPSETLTPTSLLAQSSDVGAIQVAKRIGPQALYDYLKAYGLTQKTDINWPGESSGQIYPPAAWSGTSLPTYAFGDGYDITGAQMISAVNTIADGGKYVPPRLVTALVGADGQKQPLKAPKPHRVVPRWVAREMTPMLEQVVSSGTGQAAQIPGYAIAGKTGTAATYDANGQVNNLYNNSSFAGFAPAQHPRLTVIVTISHTSLFGAQAAVPAFQQVMKDALTDLGIGSDGPQPGPSVKAVPIISGHPDTALLPAG